MENICQAANQLGCNVHASVMRSNGQYKNAIDINPISFPRVFTNSCNVRETVYAI